MYLPVEITSTGGGFRSKIVALSTASTYFATDDVDAVVVAVTGDGSAVRNFLDKMFLIFVKK